jgi:hypothetical protein
MKTFVLLVTFIFAAATAAAQQPPAEPGGPSAVQTEKHTTKAAPDYAGRKPLAAPRYTRQKPLEPLGVAPANEKLSGLLQAQTNAIKVLSTRIDKLERRLQNVERRCP